MINILKFSFGFLISQAVLYLLLCFAGGSWNPFEWNTATRIAMIVIDIPMGLCGSILIGALCVEISTDA